MRGMKGVGGSNSKAGKAKSPRQSKGETYAFAVEGGEQVVRCKNCQSAVNPLAWWDHVCPQPKEEVPF